MKKSSIMDFEWMIKYTPQTEWIKGQGIFLCLAFFFSEIGAGIYLVSIFLDCTPGWIIGWLVTLVLGGGTHAAYLGKPSRGWRILFRPGTSELSRGLWVIVLFGLVGLFQILPVVFPGLPWAEKSRLFNIIMGILCILVIVHGFLTMSGIRALPLWNSSMMMPLALISGIWTGSQVVEFVLFLSGGEVSLAETWSRWSLLVYMATMAMFLWGAFQSSGTARASLKEMFAGSTSVGFYVGTLLIGVLVPLIITLAVWIYGIEVLNANFLFFRMLCVLIGDLAMRYNIMKGAFYSPLLGS